MSYATEADLTTYASLLGVPLPANPDALLEAASRDVERLCGRWMIDTTLLLPAAVAALTRAVCAQALFRAEQGSELTIGADDGIAGIGPMSFSVQPIPRVSALVLEELDGFGLLTRTSTVLPDPPPDPTSLIFTGPYWPY